MQQGESSCCGCSCASKDTTTTTPTNGSVPQDVALYRLLYLLKERGDMDPCTLLKLQDGSLRGFYENLMKLQAEGWCNVDKGQVLLTQKGKEAPLPSGGALERLRCEGCEGRGYECKADYPPLKTYKEVAVDRPLAKEEFDQWFMTPEHALHRVGFIHARGDLLNKRLLIIGDDDLVGIAAAVTGLPEEVVVLEVDERIIDFTNKVAKDLNLKLRAQTFDARYPLPAELAKHFDVFACDPVETVEGCKVFISRGVSGLKGVGCPVYFGLTTLECDKKKWFDIQKMLMGMNFAITDVLRNFTEYPDPGWEERLPIWTHLKTKPSSVWYRSSYLRLEAIDEPKPAVANEYEGPWDFFLDDETWATTEEKI